MHCTVALGLLCWKSAPIAVKAALSEDAANTVIVPLNVDALLLVASECLKRVDLTARVRKAEQASAISARNAALGRYMLDNRHGFNNLLTSVLGNSELLLAECKQLTETARDQVETIHKMALHMHEIMQRFSSIAVELQVAEKQSQDETPEPSHMTASSS